MDDDEEEIEGGERTQRRVSRVALENADVRLLP